MASRSELVEFTAFDAVNVDGLGTITSDVIDTHGYRNFTMYVFQEEIGANTNGSGMLRLRPLFADGVTSWPEADIDVFSGDLNFTSTSTFNIRWGYDTLGVSAADLGSGGAVNGIYEYAAVAPAAVIGILRAIGMPKLQLVWETTAAAVGGNAEITVRLSFDAPSDIPKGVRI